MDKKLPIVDRLREVRYELHKVERDRHVKILFACEAGSRAWGFESTDSDYDIRFIYVRPISSYLGLSARRDVIENSDLSPVKDMDLAGWDILKALELASKSNPGIVEWLFSPVRYYEHGTFADELRDILGEFQPKALAHHYASMAHNQHKNYVAGTGETVLYKKYLYAIRPILAVLYMRANSFQLPPIKFDQLLQEMSTNSAVRPLLKHIGTLLAYKRLGTEVQAQPRIPEIDKFIEEHVAVCRQIANDESDSRQPDFLRLEDLAHRTIKQYQG